MERIAAELGVECVAGVTIGDEIVHVASAGTPAEGVIPVRVGMRSPLAPPLGASWIAWAPYQDVERWLGHCSPPLTEDERAQWKEALGRQRRRGWWIRLGGATQQEFDEHIARLTSQPATDRRRAFGEIFRGPPSTEYAQPDIEPDGTYEVRAISAPVFCPDGRTVRYALILFGLPERCSGTELQCYADRLLEGCRVAAAALGTRPRAIT
jgi:DNA-binding IclR family transcriptional regulator